MEQKQIEVIKNRIKSKIEKGDFITLSKVLDIPRSTAVSRYNRNNENAVLIIRKIVTEREKLIKKLKAKI